MNSADQRYRHQINPNISVDCVVFGFDGGALKVLLIERSSRDNLDLEDDVLVLPGDLIHDQEDLDEAAGRVLNELTGLQNIYLEQIGAFGSPDRLSKPSDQRWLKAVRLKPHARVITIGYFALINASDYRLRPSGFAQGAKWLDLKALGELGFDHNRIVEAAVDQLRQKLYREPIGFELLPEKFSLHELYSIYQGILSSDIDRRNFRRKMLKTGFLKETNEFQEGVPHKPARLYTFVKEVFDSPRHNKFKFY